MRLLDDLDPFSFLVAETKKEPGFEAETKKFGSLLLIQGAQVILLRPANWARHSFAPVAYGRGEAAASPCFGNRARQQASPHGVDDLGQTRRKEPRTWRITRHIV